MKVTVIPDVLSQYLKTFRKLMSKPQFAHFSAYCTGLIMAEKKSIRQIANALPHGHQSSLNRFITRGKWNHEHARHKALDLVKPYARNSAFIIDDSCAHKTGEKMEGAAFHYDHLHKKKCFGYSIVTSGYAKKRQFIPFRLRVYQRKERLAPGSRFCTKNELALQILEEALLFQSFRYAVVDAWYTNKKILRFIMEHKQLYMGDLKSNRKVTIRRAKKAVADHCYITKMQELVIDHQLYRAYAEDAYLPGIGRARIIFSQLKREDGWTDVKYLVTNMFHLTVMQSINAYLGRHAIEGFHRDAKQDVAFETFHMRKYAGVVTHLACVMISYLLILLSKIASGMRGTIGKICKKMRLKAERHTLNLFMSCKASLKTKQQAASFICC
jgi:hypothetical protein